MRAPKACSHPDCPNTQPCPDHAPKPWATKNGRGNRMRSGSREQKINRAVMEQHEGRCHRCGLLGSDQVDHVIPLTVEARLPEHRHLDGAYIDSMENRRPIHSEPCHREKTAEEQARGRSAGA